MNSRNVSSNGERVYSTLIRVPVSRGLFSECVGYRNVKVLVANSFDFRPELTRDDSIKLASENCTTEQFTCPTGVAIVRPLTRCIDRRQQCNRIVDCEDKSDELSCNGDSNTRDNEFFQCPTGYVKCQDGKSCYRKAEQTCGKIPTICSSCDSPRLRAE